MTTWTANLEVPHLDQNVAQPEIPENVAKNILDAVFAGKYTTDFPSDADYIYAYVADPTSEQPWHNFVQDFTDTGFPLTTGRTVTFPVNNRPYLLINNTDQPLYFKITGQVGSITLANGGSNMYCYSDGTDLIKMEFAASSLSNGLLVGATLNLGSISGGSVENVDLIGIDFTNQTVISSANAMTISLDNGHHVYYNAVEATTITIDEGARTNTFFKMLIHDGATSAPTFPASVKWAGGVAPVWTVGDDFVEFTLINSVWVGHAVALNVS